VKNAPRCLRCAGVSAGLLKLPKVNDETPLRQGWSEEKNYHRQFLILSTLGVDQIIGSALSSGSDINRKADVLVCISVEPLAARNLGSECNLRALGCRGIPLREIGRRTPISHVIVHSLGGCFAKVLGLYSEPLAWEPS
jgi:energy-converting hydrogenase Eha subunit A